MSRKVRRRTIKRKSLSKIRKTNRRKTNRRKTNRRKTNRRKTNRRKTNRKTNRRKTNRRKTNRPKKRGRKQRGGGALGNCQNPFVKGTVNYEPYGMDLRGGIPTRLTDGADLQNGGGLWRNLGLTFPKDLYHDSKDFLSNVKNSYMGDRQDVTSNVMKQPIGKMELQHSAPTDFSKAFIDADAAVAAKMQSLS